MDQKGGLFSVSIFEDLLQIWCSFYAFFMKIVRRSPTSPSKVIYMDF